jgi:NAD(P)-dependent dehydrogenase (short-subunit alcohol dehydrogenase family)
MAETVERMGRVDIVVANAGLCDWQTVAEMSADLWDRLVGVNLHGCFNVVASVSRPPLSAAMATRVAYPRDLDTAARIGACAPLARLRRHAHRGHPRRLAPDRCGSGEIVDHRALAWCAPTPAEIEIL